MMIYIRMNKMNGRIIENINLEDIINQITYYKYMFKDSSFIYK